jgi:hypothetical protein
MSDKIYLSRAGYYEDGNDHFSRYCAVVAKTRRGADKKWLNYCNDHSRGVHWTCSNSEELTSGKDLPLELRLKIIDEVLRKQYGLKRFGAVIR